MHERKWVENNVQNETKKQSKEVPVQVGHSGTQYIG